jgi:hypothetical protein
MRCFRGGRVAVLTSLTVTSLLLAEAAPSRAGPDDGGGDEGKGGQDLALPASDVTAQAAGAGVSADTTELGPVGDTGTSLATRRLDDFRYDRQVTEGYARDVCNGRLRPGTARAFFELQRRFGGSPGSMYVCRERWNAAEEPDCNGTVVDPNTNPTFFSTCWSNHAAGRALDVMSTKARGDAIVRWLLAPDARGRYSANARRLGVQQILWWDRCWNTDDDRGVMRFRRMRECGIGHFDHVHIDLTIAGAEGRTSYWGWPPNVSRKFNGLLWWDNQTGKWKVQSWFNYRPTDRRARRFGTKWDEAIPGDWNKDGVDDDMLLWNRDTGAWSLQSWARYRRTPVRTGTFWRTWDQLIPGDWDGNRRNNDLFLWDRDTGAWAVRSFAGRESRFRNSGLLHKAFDTIRVGDFDEDNRLDEMFVRDRHTGRFQIISWDSWRPSVEGRSWWPRRFSQFVVGDWDSDGEINDMLRRNRSTGGWRMYSWDDFRPTRRRSAGIWLRRFSQIVAADLDGEGRVDDMLVRSPRTGQWHVIEWHYYRPRHRYRTPGLRHWDQLIAGQWGWL